MDTWAPRHMGRLKVHRQVQEAIQNRTAQGCAENDTQPPNGLKK